MEKKNIFCEVAGQEVTIEPKEGRVPMEDGNTRLIVDKQCSYFCTKQGQCGHTKSEIYNELCDGSRVRVSEG